MEEIERKIRNKSKKISNPFSTGGGGEHFEAQVQASFVVLMLTGGFAPSMPRWPIKKIKLQGKFAGYDTDDLIIFLKKTNNKESKILGQIKHSIRITKNDNNFEDVIQAAWNDFNNKKLFSKEDDNIALITGPLSKTDIKNVRTILEWARHMENANEFINNVNRINFSSKRKIAKLQAFKENLKKAKDSNELSDEILFNFLRHFHLLGYDLDIKAGVNLSFLYSLIGQYSQEKIQWLWGRLIEEVQFTNQNAGTITLDSLPNDITDIFKQHTYEVFPKELLIKKELPTENQIDWNNHKYASALMIANLIGGWNEKKSADTKVLRKLVNEDFNSWLSKIREILQDPESPIDLKNGKWRINERKNLWHSLSPRIFDDNLDKFKQCAITVLTEHDPKFELPPEKRYAASIYKKTMKYSSEIRKGVAESLAYLGSYSDDLINCTENKPENIVTSTLREILSDANWELWGSLNTLLPILAEAAPKEFLKIVENTLKQTPCPFDHLFSEEGKGIFGGDNYLTGLLWALETLAWDKKYLVQVCVILGNLTKLDPGGNYANRPANSLTSIFLPWFPQTTASLEKRKAALKTLKKEFPSVAWNLLVSLLPNQAKVSSGTYKPSWRNFIPKDWEKGVTKQEYWEQVSVYIELTVTMAKDDMDKLKEIVSKLGNFPKSSVNKFLEYLSSDTILSKPEKERLPIWNTLKELILKNKRYSNENWSLNNKIIESIEEVTEKLAPTNPLYRYCRLFSNPEIDLFENKGDWQEQRKILEESRQKAMKKILDYGGVDSIKKFADMVDSPSYVGFSLGCIADSEIDTDILPDLLSTDIRAFIQFTSSYISSRQNNQGWEWVDNLDKSGWSHEQIAQLLSCLPFNNETWDRARSWLDDYEKVYWKKARVNPYQTSGDLEIAINKLIEYQRPFAAIDCLYKIFNEEQQLNKSQSIKALENAVKFNESSSRMDSYRIVEIIKVLQNDPNTCPEELYGIEWSYLTLLHQYDDVSPVNIENRLSSDPKFFCEIIQLVYKSKEDESDRDLNEKEKKIAENAWKLLYEWQTPPGIKSDGSFSKEKFDKWLEFVKKECTESGHLEVALVHVGKVLIHCPKDPDGLWINKAVAKALNNKNAEELREGFSNSIINSRGVHWVDPSGSPERNLAKEYRQKAEDIENSGFHRLAITLRDIAEFYDREAERIID